MNRRTFLEWSAFYSFLLAGRRLDCSADKEPEIERGAPTPEPLAESHFPDRLHLFVWRNWELTNLDRMAEILGTTLHKVLAIGYSMGLPSKPRLTQDQLRRIYITVIRQNWHILPTGQLIQLLGWDQAEYEYHLTEDDFLWMKLGALKPHCEPLHYEEPTAEMRQRADRIKQLVKAALGPALDDAGEPAFQFVADLSSADVPILLASQSKPLKGEVALNQGWTLRNTGQDSAVSPRVLEEFQEYLRSAFGCEVSLSDKQAGSKVLEVSVDSSIPGAVGSFVLRVQPERISVVGHDFGGVRQALYFLKDQMENRQAPYLPSGEVRRLAHLDPRYVYSYFALYGDPLVEPSIASLPDGFLEKLARAGINGVWLQGVLRNLAPSKIFPEFGMGSETRLLNLGRLVERAKLYGVDIHLYLNEPRAMPAEFFDRHTGIRGTYDTGDPRFAMCTSTSEVREWLAESLEHMFSRVPALGGVFCITASENLTNCYSHGHADLCPRCSKRDGSEVIAEVIQTFRDGVRRSSQTATVVAWDWGWGQDWVKNGADSANVIRRLAHDVGLMSVSEWEKPTNRGGFPTKVGEYSISVVGPGPRAIRNWDLARQQGLHTLAKVQWSSTWEISAVPYIPVPNLIAEHCENLLKEGVQGLLTSWTVGGYPSPNFEVAKEYYFSDPPDRDHVLHDVAVRRYGREAVSRILEAWETFSRAFVQYPMEGGGVVYQIPVQHGPSNLLRLHPTSYKATTMLFPYDDYRSWVGTYPVEIVEEQFRRMAQIWEVGLNTFREAMPFVAQHKRKMAQNDLGIAETCYLHFQSVANQIQFYRLREEWTQATSEVRSRIADRMANIAEVEIELAKRQYAIARHDSTIAYEASNHYYYRPLDLMEKVLNCREVIDRLRSVARS
jgi:hypothetical protein